MICNVVITDDPRERMNRPILMSTLEDSLKNKYIYIESYIPPASLVVRQHRVTERQEIMYTPQEDS